MTCSWCENPLINPGSMLVSYFEDGKVLGTDFFCGRDCCLRWMISSEAGDDLEAYKEVLGILGLSEDEFV